MEMMCAEYLMPEGKSLTCRELVFISDWDDDSACATPAASLTSYSFHAGLRLARHLCCICFGPPSDILITSTDHNGLDGCRSNLINPGQRRVRQVDSDGFRQG